nr:hypothetical protein [Streptomyces sp. NRRL S-474]
MRATGIPARGLRFLLERRRVLLRLTAWSVLETGQTFLLGYGPARALDDGFLRGRADAGLAWLAVTGLGVLIGSYGTARVYAAVAALVEPFRDRLVERVVSRGVRTGDSGSLSGLTQQVEIARDTFAGLVMVSRSFVFTAAGALAGLFTLAPPLLLVVGPPLAAGVVLFAATLRPLARRQETFLVADEALAGQLGAVCPGLRDIAATGAEAHIAAGTGERVEAELRAARALAHWGVLRVTSLALGGQVPIVLLLATAPWLLTHGGVTTGALVGALAYVTQSLLPALRNLIHGLGTSGSRLTVVLRRLAPTAAAPGAGDAARPGAPASLPAADANHGDTLRRDDALTLADADSTHPDGPLTPADADTTHTDTTHPNRPLTPPTPTPPTPTPPTRTGRSPLPTPTPPTPTPPTRTAASARRPPWTGLATPHHAPKLRAVSPPSARPPPSPSPPSPSPTVPPAPPSSRTSASASRRARTWPSWARAAPASPRSPPSSPGCSRPTGARSRWADTPCPGRRPSPHACSSHRRLMSSAGPWRRTSRTCARTRSPRTRCWPRPRRSASRRWPTGSAASARGSIRQHCRPASGSWSR